MPADKFSRHGRRIAAGKATSKQHPFQRLNDETTSISNVEWKIMSEAKEATLQEEEATLQEEQKEATEPTERGRNYRGRCSCLSTTLLSHPW